MADDVENNSSAQFTNTSLLLASRLSLMEGVAWCSAFAVVSFFIVVGNVLAIIVFALNKNLRKKSFLLVINMACADLMLGALSLPLFIYQLGGDFDIWPKQWNFSLNLFYRAIDTVCALSSIITAAFIAIERFYAIGWPLKHRSIARRRAYYISIFLTWLLSVALSASIVGSLYKSIDVAVIIWVSYASILTLTICVCYIGIWTKFTLGRKDIRGDNIGTSQNKRSTKTLLLITAIALLSWLPLIVTNTASVYILVDKHIVLTVNLLNFCNSFANPVLYSLRIPEFRKALCLRERKKGKGKVARLAVTTTAIHLHVAFKQAVDVSGLLDHKEHNGEETETEFRSWLKLLSLNEIRILGAKLKLKCMSAQFYCKRLVNRWLLYQKVIQSLALKLELIRNMMFWKCPWFKTGKNGWKLNWADIFLGIDWTAAKLLKLTMMPIESSHSLFLLKCLRFQFTCDKCTEKNGKNDGGLKSQTLAFSPNVSFTVNCWPWLNIL